MPTKEVLGQWEAVSPTAKGEGPLQGTTNRSFPSKLSFPSSYSVVTIAAHSLVSAHDCFAARPNAEGCEHPYHDGRLGPEQVLELKYHILS